MSAHAHVNLHAVCPGAKRGGPVAGVPQPDIVWYKDAVAIEPGKMLRYRVLVGGSLQVNGLLPDDTGMFQCFARNVAGEVQTNTYLAVTSEFWTRPSPTSPSFVPSWQLAMSHVDFCQHRPAPNFGYGHQLIPIFTVVELT